MKAKISKQAIEQTFAEKLKQESMKNLIMGFEVANNMILDYINNGHTLEEVRTFVQKNVNVGADVIKQNTK